VFFLTWDAIYNQSFLFTNWCTRLDVRGSVHHSTVRKEKNPTRCNKVSKFYYSIFIWSSTYFGRHTAHHQKPKTVLAASGFSYVEGCWTCSWWTLLGTVWLETRCTIKSFLFTNWCTRLDVRGSVHHSTVHKEKSNKMQQCVKILLFHIYMELNMFRATHRPSSEA